MKQKTLTDLQIRKIKKPGKYCDRDGLRLQVTANANTGVVRKSWIVRFTSPNGKVRDMGLGTYDDLSLSNAREKAFDVRRLARTGVDPLDVRGTAGPAQDLPSKRPTFRECAEEFIELNKSGWRNSKHADQWTNTLATYAYPYFGDLPIDRVNIDHVLSVLRPIWHTKTETASRVRQRMERVLAFGAVKGHRERQNPAQWRHNLELILPDPTKVAKVVHHPALPMDEMQDFFKVLHGRNSMGSLSFEFCILTVTRSSETLCAEWREIDLDAGKWTIPPERMKGNIEHVVPIFGRTAEILRLVRKMSGHGKYVFPGRKPGRHQCVTVFDKALERWGYDHVTAHGFRSTFRDWSAEKTECDDAVGEAVLAHVINNKAKKAYLRTKFFDKRKALMLEWQQFCLGEINPANDADGDIVAKVA